MHFKSCIHTVDTHTEGQPTRIVTSGIGFLRGRTMADKRDYFAANLDHVRTSLIAEPRGHRDQYGCILTDPCDPDADFGIFYMHNSGYMDMCGHATIGLSTALVELGMVEVVEPVTRIVYDSPSGIVTADVDVEGGRAQGVTFENVPGYVHHLDAKIHVQGIGELIVDVGFGGNDFVWYDADAIGLEISPTNVREIVETGMRVMRAANDQLPIRDPYTGKPKPINIATALTRPRADQPAFRNVHVFGPGQFDRSPGGTGTTARLSALRSKGLIELGQIVTVESGVTEGVFRGRVNRETTIGSGTPAFITQVSGSAYITGMHQFVVDPKDRLQHGFLMQDV